MTSQKLSRRNMLKATAASAAAAGMVDGLLDPNSAWAQSDRPLRIRTNRTPRPIPATWSAVSR